MNSLDKSNTRFIYQKTDEAFSDMIEIIESIDHYIFHEKSLDYQNRQVIIYFINNELFVGREVIGFPSNIPEGISYRDFKGQELEQVDVSFKAQSYQELNEYLRSRHGQMSKYIKIKLKNGTRLEFASFRG
jgi:hypothetical protein